MVSGLALAMDYLLNAGYMHDSLLLERVLTVAVQAPCLLSMAPVMAELFESDMSPPSAASETRICSHSYLRMDNLVGSDLTCFPQEEYEQHSACIDRRVVRERR